MRRLLAVTVLVTLLSAGCGIPDDSDVAVDRAGPSTGTSVGDDGVPPDQHTRTTTTDPVLFLKYYLQAAAGDPETATNRVKEFLAPGTPFRGGTELKVVRLLEEPRWTRDQPEISVKVRQVGTLNANGLFEPDPVADTTPYKFKIDRIEGQDGLFVLKAPDLMLLSDTAMETYYQPRTIYFWNKDNTSLVPDLRYMPRSVIPVQQPTVILSWLANGPATWLNDAVNKLPQGTTAPDNVPAINNETLQVTLTAPSLKPGDRTALDRLRRQLQWSLLPLEPRTLEIKIGHEDPVSFRDQAYRDSNVAYRLADVPERFVIYNGAIRRLADFPHAEDPVPVLKAAANKNIETAALSASTTHTFAAVVTRGGGNQQLRVAAAPFGAESDLIEVRGLSGTLGRPVWAVTTGNDLAGSVGLITSNGKLYSFAADGSTAQRVEWPGEPGLISSVSVAPDGHRVALVSGGRLYRAVLATGADGIALSEAERVLPPGLTQVAAVAWGSETYLAVAGIRADGRYRVIDVSIDGALSGTRLDDIALQPVTDLIAYPANPTAGDREAGSDLEAVVAGGAAWDVFVEPQKITVDDLAGPSAGAPAGATPTAPFFLD